MLKQAGALQVVAHHQGTRGQAGLDPGLDLQAACTGLLGEQPGPDHHGWVGGVGAGGDGGDGHGPVGEFVGSPLRRGDGDAARATASLAHLAYGVAAAVRQLAQGDAVLWTLRPGQAGFYGGQIQRYHLTVAGWWAVGIVPQALCLRVALYQLQTLHRASGQPQIVQHLLIDGKQATGGPVFGCHVGDGGPVRQWQLCQAATEKLHKLSDHTVLAQPFRDRQHQVGGGHALSQPAAEFHADHGGDQHADRLSQHGGLGLYAANPPAQYPQAVDHGGMGVGAHQGVRVGHPAPVLPAAEDAAGEVLQVDLVHDTDIRGHDLQVVEGLLSPAQELVAFPVALKLYGGIACCGIGLSVMVHLHRVIDHQLCG